MSNCEGRVTASIARIRAFDSLGGCFSALQFQLGLIEADCNSMNTWEKDEYDEEVWYTFWTSHCFSKHDHIVNMTRPLPLSFVIPISSEHAPPVSPNIPTFCTSCTPIFEL